MEIKYTGENHTPVLSGKEYAVYLGIKPGYRIRSQQKEFKCGRGQALLIKDADNIPWEFTTYGAKIFAFTITEEWCREHDVIFPELPSQEFIKGGKINSLIVKLYDAYLLNNHTRDLRVESVFLDLVATIIEEQEELMKKNNRWADFFKELMASGEFLTLDETAIARKAGVSTGHLSRCITEHCGCNFRTLHANMKLEYAGVLIKEGILNDDEIAERLGYANYKSLNRQFKKFHDCNMRQYREREK